LKKLTVLAFFITVGTAFSLQKKNKCKKSGDHHTKNKIAKQISKSSSMQELRRAESPARDCIGSAATPGG
jgi:hypothetical protein